MDPTNSDTPFPLPAAPAPPARLRLYVARSTPNSVRAEYNLAAVLNSLPDGLAPPTLDIIDVFSQAHRALTDGVVATPTLIGLAAGKRMLLMGDLSDEAGLRRTIHDLIQTAAGVYADIANRPG